MTNQPPPPPGNYPPSPPGDYPPQGNYPPPPPGSYPPPPPGNYPPPPPGGYGPPNQMGGYPPAGGGYPPAGYSQPGGQGVGSSLPQDAYTPWFTRVLAWLIDSIPIFIVVGIGQGIAIGTADNVCTSGGYGSYGVSCVSTPSLAGVLLSLLASLLAFAYVIWNLGYRQGTTGSSIGKGIMKFKVISEKTGQPIGFGLSVVRQLAHFVDSIICYIGYLFPLWDAKRQTLADKIMTTVCVPL